MAEPARRLEGQPFKLRRAEDDDAGADRLQAAGVQAGAVPIGDLGLQAADLAVDGIADRERRKCAIRSRLLLACPALDAPRSRWVADRAAELIGDGGADPASLDRAIRDYEAMRDILGPKMKNPPGYIQKLLSKHFGATWRDWSKPPE